MKKRSFAGGLTAVLVALSVSAGSAKEAVEKRHDDHQQLRAMLATVAEALNSRNVDALAPLLSGKFSIVTMDQKRFTSLPEVKGYFEGFFKGDKPLLKKVSFKPSADALTEFLSQDVGVCHGTSQDTYDFTDGDTRTMNSRWSAVVVKERGTWKLASLHVGVDLMDNPVLSALKDSLYKAAGAGLLAGLLLGFLLPKAFSAVKG